MKKDPVIFVSHVIESIGFIQEDIQGVSWDDFMASRQLQDIVIRRIEIIGEAVKNLPPDVKDRYPDVPWKRIAGMRDILAHGYFGVDLDLVWKVAIDELGPLKLRLQEIRRELEEGATPSG